MPELESLSCYHLAPLDKTLCPSPHLKQGDGRNTRAGALEPESLSPRLGFYTGVTVLPNSGPVRTKWLNTVRCSEPGPAAHCNPSLLTLKNYIYLFVCVTVLTRELEDNLWELVFSFYHMSLGQAWQQALLSTEPSCAHGLILCSL